MKTLIIGTGYVGVATGVALALKGHEIYFTDKDKSKIKLLKEGKVPFYEKGLEETLQKVIKDKKVFFVDLKHVIEKIDAIYICVNTPILKSGRTNLKSLINALKEIVNNSKQGLTIVIKSTINPNDYEIIQKIFNKNNFYLAINPEFLREGNALTDAINPSRIVVGVENEKAKQILEEIYRDFAVPKVFTDPLSAILIKYASNSFLTTKISFINEIANLADEIGANIDDISLGIGLDPRIGKEFLKAGIGYGGSCLPKDSKNIVKYSKSIGKKSRIIEAAYKVNEEQYKVVIDKLKKHLGPLSAKKIAILGLSFKGGTDDIRNSVSLMLIRDLIKEGADLKVHDFLAIKNAKELLNNLLLSDNPYIVIEDSEALVIATDWREYNNLDWEKVKSLMKGNLIIDGRNILNKELKEQLKNRFGFIYEGIGRR